MTAGESEHPRLRLSMPGEEPAGSPAFGLYEFGLVTPWPAWPRAWREDVAEELLVDVSIQGQRYGSFSRRWRGVEWGRRRKELLRAEPSGRKDDEIPPFIPRFYLSLDVRTFLEN